MGGVSHGAKYENKHTKQRNAEKKARVLRARRIERLAHVSRRFDALAGFKKLAKIEALAADDRGIMPTCEQSPPGKQKLFDVRSTLRNKQPNRSSDRLWLSRVALRNGKRCGKRCRKREKG